MLLLWLVCIAAPCNVTYAQTRAETVIHNFSSAPQGSYGDAALVQDSSGNLYGTNSTNGRGGGGTVFRLAPSGAFTVLHDFSVNSVDGNGPSGVILDPAGNLYGATEFGGPANCGVVYEITSGGKETILYAFQGGSDGCRPTGSLLLDSSGNLYGATIAGGGFANVGTAFKLYSSGNETILHAFAGIDGSLPNGNLVLSTSGNLIGTTVSGGSDNSGIVYSLAPSGEETILHVFTGKADGKNPNAGLILDPAGNLYGTTISGGASEAGVVFQLEAQNNFQLDIIYSFHAQADGGFPNSTLIRGQNGNLYGTASCCGQNSDNDGVVFQVSPAGQESVVFAFTSSLPGAAVPIGLLLGTNGDLYGYAGLGSHRQGLVYSLTRLGQFTVLHAFPNSRGGYNPISNVVFDPSKNLWGVTDDAGDSDNSTGTVYAIDPSGRETRIYTFGGPFGTDQRLAGPTSGVIFDKTGNGYGEAGGAIYKITPARELTTLYTFSSQQGKPLGGLALDSSGNLYGLAFSFTGTNGEGSFVFRLDPAGNVTVLYTFLLGVYPSGQQVLDSAGNIYGTTESGGAFGQGSVYKISPSGREEVLYAFTGTSDGAGPTAGVVLDSAGNLFGTTYFGGRFGGGVVFEISGGVEKVLLNFDGTNGQYPNAIILDSQDTVYGTTLQGGSSNLGVAYSVSTKGAATVLHEFTGGADGGTPAAGLLLGPSGVLYGTASIGGKYNGGVVFELK